MLDLTLDAMDSTGEQHLKIEHNIYKKRLDLKGVPIEAGVKSEVNTKKVASNSSMPNLPSTTTAAPAEEEPNKCGDCYGAKHNETQYAILNVLR